MYINADKKKIDFSFISKLSKTYDQARLKMIRANLFIRLGNHRTKETYNNFLGISRQKSISKCRLGCFGIMQGYITRAMLILTIKMGMFLNKLKLESLILNKRKKESSFAQQKIILKR